MLNISRTSICVPLIFLLFLANNSVLAQERICPDGKRSYFGVCPQDENNSRPIPKQDPSPSTTGQGTVLNPKPESRPALVGQGDVSPRIDATFPTRPINLVVPFAAGGAADVTARTLAQRLGTAVGQNVLVVNKPGAGGMLGANEVARAPADGYTLLFNHMGMATVSTLYRNPSFNAINDFEPIGQVVDFPMSLIARKGIPVQTVLDLQNYAKANAGRITVATSGIGSNSHLCAMALQRALGVQIFYVPYKGAAPALADLVAGQVDLFCDQLVVTLPQTSAGRANMVGITTQNRIKAAPQLPTLHEQGLRGFDVSMWNGIYAPKGAPTEVINKLNVALKIALRDPGLIQQMERFGGEMLSEASLNPESLRLKLRSETERWGRLLRAEGVTVD